MNLNRCPKLLDQISAPPEEVERLRLLADSLYHAVVDFQLLEAGSLPGSIH